MGTKNVRLEEDVYNRIAAHKEDDETFSEAIDRLTGGCTLVDYAENTEPVAVTNDELEERISLLHEEHVEDA
jgi:predicted CopG family antitoxin